MIDCPVFLINLNGSDKRLAQSAAQFADGNIAFQRLGAVDGRGKPLDSFPQYNDAKARAFFGRPMTSGEIGCYLSHVKAAKAIVESGADMGLVFEDDFHAHPHAWETLHQLIMHLRKGASPNWELVNLARPAKHFRHNLAELQTDAVPRTTLTNAFYFPVIATALLWSRAGAEALLSTYSAPCGPVDHVFRRLLSDRGTGLALSRPPFGVTGIDSDIVIASGGYKPPRLYRGVWSLWRSELERQIHALRAARIHARKATGR